VSAAPEPLTKRQRQGAESRGVILDAAERLMALNGVAGTSISALTSESGLPASSIYWHFGSKDGVLVAVMERGAERFFQSLAPTESFIGSTQERVTAQLEDTSRALEEHGDFLRLLLTLVLLRGEGSDTAGTVIASLRGRGRERAEEMLVAAGGGGLSARWSTRELGSFALAAIDGAFIAHHEDPEVDLFNLLRQLAAALVVLMDPERG
jgi:AcrR family transcriptional regulator